MDHVDLSRLKEMVESRHEIQLLCFQIVEFMNEHHADIEQHKKSRSHIAQLAGAAFSLWRAVFLTELAESGELILTAKSFLEKVVRTNMIGFSDDLSMQAWSCGYYLNNAKYRILLIARENVSCRNRLKQASSEAYKGREIYYLLHNEISGKDRQQVWGDFFNACRIAFDCVRVDFLTWRDKAAKDKRRKPKRPPVSE
jgi:hypothetical protein